MIVRASRHSFSDTNLLKYENLSNFLLDYADATQQFIDYLWNNRIEIKKYIFDIKTKEYNLPNFLSNKDIPAISELSARILKTSLTQAIGIVSSAVAKFKKKQYFVKKKQKTQDTYVRKWQSWLDKHTPTKPVIDKLNFNPELNSINCVYERNKNINSEISGFITLSSLYDRKSQTRTKLLDKNNKISNRIIIPIKMTARSNYWERKGKMMPSFLINRRFVAIRWEIETLKNNSTKIVGADTGQTTTLTLSDGNITTKCPHGHDLKSINNKMARQKPGSKAFRKSQLHRINYINWSIKYLNLGQYGIIRLESNKYVKYGKSTSKSLRHWSFADIYKTIKLIGEEYDVQIHLQKAAYKSQRCNACGWVQKGNRLSKLFRCRHCGHTDDADMNSSKNNLVDLPVISKSFRDTGLNKKGFFWLSDGIFLKEVCIGAEFTLVPLTQKFKC